MSRKKLAWANKEVETFVCILGEEDVVYDVYVAATAIDIRPTTKGFCLVLQVLQAPVWVCVILRGCAVLVLSALQSDQCRTNELIHVSQRQRGAAEQRSEARANQHECYWKASALRPGQSARVLLEGFSAPPGPISTSVTGRLQRSARANQHECYWKASALRSALIYHPELSADVDPNRLTVQVLSGRGINEQMWGGLIWEDYRGLDPWGSPGVWTHGAVQGSGPIGRGSGPIGRSRGLEP
ncbi:unnamed protein product [Boreogadus saida]